MEDLQCRIWQAVKTQRLETEDVKREVKTLETTVKEVKDDQIQLREEVKDISTNVDARLDEIASGEDALPSGYVPWFRCLPRGEPLPSNRPYRKNERSRLLEIIDSLSMKRYKPMEERQRIGDSYKTKFYHKDVLGEAYLQWKNESPRLFQ